MRNYWLDPIKGTFIGERRRSLFTLNSFQRFKCVFNFVSSLHELFRLEQHALTLEDKQVHIQHNLLAYFYFKNMQNIDFFIKTYDSKIAFSGIINCNIHTNKLTAIAYDFFASKIRITCSVSC